MDDNPFLNLEKEIERDYLQVESKERILERDDHSNSIKTRLFTYLAWLFVLLGLFPIVYGMLQLSDEPDGLKLNEYGDFLAGTVASAWSLAGIFFIYVSLLGQRIELRQGKLEQLYGRIEMKHNRLEMMRQKLALREQVQMTERTLIENQFYNLLGSIEGAVAQCKSEIRMGSISSTQCLGEEAILYMLDSLQGTFEEPRELNSDVLDIISSLEIWKKDIKKTFSFDPLIHNTVEIILHLHNGKEVIDARHLFNMFKSRISKYVLLFVFYGILDRLSNEQKVFVGKHDFFKGLINRGELFHREHARLYAHIQ